MSCFSSGDIYLSLDISLLFLFVTVSELFCCEFFDSFVILLANLLSIKSPVAFAGFWIALFEAVLKAVVADCLTLSKSCCIYHSSFYLCIYPNFLPIFLAEDKNP